MTPSDLLTNLIGRGIQVQPNGNRLRIGPRDRLTPADLKQLCRHKAVILRLLRSEVIQAATIDGYPVIPGRVRFDFFHTSEDIEAGRWGTEFIPGYHFDPRQPSSLRGLFLPPDNET